MISINSNCVKYIISNTALMLSSNVLQFFLSLFVLKQTGSAIMFSFMLSIIIIPRLLITPFAGVWGDKYNRKKLMQACFIAYNIIYLIFAFLFYIFSENSISIIFLFVVIIELIECTYSTVSTSMIPMMTNKDNIGFVTSISMVGDSIVRIFSPVIAGVLFAVLSVVNTIVLLDVFIFFALLLYSTIELNTIVNIDANTKGRNSISLLIETKNLIFESPLLKNIVIIAPLVNFFLSPLLTITYLYYLNQILELSSSQVGIFQAAIGISISIGALIAAFLLKTKSLEIVLNRSVGLIAITILMQFFIIVFLKTKTAMVVMFLLTSVLISASLAIMNASTSTMFKQKVPMNYMARIASVIGLLATISLPLGQILFGTIAEYLPVYLSFFISFSGMTGVYFLSKRFL